MRVSPTTDRNELKSAVRRLQLGERTAIGEAIYASLDAVKAAPPGPKGEKVPARIVLMSDGETTVGRPDSEAAAAAAEQKVPVSTIAFGTDHGTIQLPGEDLPDAGAGQRRRPAGTSPTPPTAPPSPPPPATS